MILPSTHGAAGIFTFYLLSWIFKIPFDNKLFIFAVCMSDIADIDFIFYGIRHTFKLNRYSHRHRKTLLHSTPIYWIITIFIYFFGNSVYALVFSVSAFSHLFLDTISSGCGIRWLWPFKDTRYRIKLIKPGLERFSEFQLLKIVKGKGSDQWLKKFFLWNNFQLWFELAMTIFFFAIIIKKLV